LLSKKNSDRQGACRYVFLIRRHYFWSLKGLGFEGVLGCDEAVLPEQQRVDGMLLLA